MTRADAQLWDAQADAFDDEPDHGLRDPSVRAAWLALLREYLPPAPIRLVDLGCGTGSLATLVAFEWAAEIAGFDLSRQMVARAVAKSSLRPAGYGVADAARPPLADACVDVVLGASPVGSPGPARGADPLAQLLRPGGRLVLVEGCWSTGAGIPMADCVEAVAAVGQVQHAVPLPDPALWGRPIEDERYLVVGSPDRQCGDTDPCSRPVSPH